MKFPTLEAVEAASHEQLAEWYRFLKSPGQAHIGEPNFEELMDQEVKILDRIIERFTALGGWNPALSKKVGWDPR